MTVVELVLSAAAIVVAAALFTNAVEILGERLDLGQGAVGSVLAPLATELPEKFNSVIWLRGNKDTLALGNITGAMVFQSSVPVALGLAFTSWSFDLLNLLSAALALAGGAYLYVLVRRKEPIEAEYLLVGGALYAVFLAVALVTIL